MPSDQQGVPNLSTSLALVRGSAPRALVRQQAKTLVRRKAHDLVLVATSEGIPKEGFHFWADLRRGRRHIWGGILRVVDVLIDRGHSEAIVQLIPRILSEYIADQFRGKTPPSGDNVRAA